MATSGFEPTHVRGQDPFADLSVEATLVDPKYALPPELRQLADKLAQEESPAPKHVLPPGAVTRVKVRVNQLGSGNATQIGEMIPADMDVLMTAHLPTAYSLDDIAGDELEPELCEPIVRPVRDFSDEDEPKTVNAFIEHALPKDVRAPRDMIETLEPDRELDRDFDPDPTLPPMRLSKVMRPSPPKRDGFVSPSSIPADEITKTCFGKNPLNEEVAFRDGSGALRGLSDGYAADDESFGDVPGYGPDSLDDLPGLPQEKRSFEQVLERVRAPRPRHDVAPQRYIQTKITSNPKIGIMPEDTSIVLSERDDAPDGRSGFADGKPYQMATAEADALTKPPRTVSPYIIVGLGVIGAIVALFHAIQAPL